MVRTAEISDIKIDLTEADANKAKMSWKKLECNATDNFPDFALQSEVLLFADVFENFRKFFEEKFELDPCNYYSAPNSTWDAMLKTTAADIELLSDIDMLLLCDVRKNC